MGQKKIFILLIAAVSAVAVADVFLKKTQNSANLYQAIVNPWMGGAVVLYLFQIVAFTFLFQKGIGLIYVAVLQVILYAIITIFSGSIIFKENITGLQKIAICVGIISVMLMNENFPNFLKQIYKLVKEIFV